MRLPLAPRSAEALAGAAAVLALTPQLTASLSVQVEEPAGQANESALEFVREDRSMRGRYVREILAPARWTDHGTDSSGEFCRHPEPIQTHFGQQLYPRSKGFSESVAVLPAGERRDGSSMPPTCVFSLPHDIRGSLWFLTPDGLDGECLTGRNLDQDVRRFGRSVEVGPDHDGDGIRELIVTALATPDEGGYAYLVSVAERSVVQRLRDESASKSFGVAACAIPDEDGDGREDVAILSGPPIPRVALFSSATGEVLRRIDLTPRPVKDCWRPHHRLRVLPNADPRASTLLMISIPGTYVEELAVLDLASERVRWSESCGRTNFHTDLHWCSYSSAVPTEDLDGDGVSELLAAGRDRDKSARDSAQYAVISGATGEVLRTVSGIHYHAGGDGDAFVADYPDVDGDGFREHIVTATGFMSSEFHIYSGRTGEPLYQVELDELPYEYTNDVQSHVDWDQDGTLDLVLHDTDVWTYGYEQQLIVLSMKEHEVLHFIRPGDVERKILERDGSLEALEARQRAEAERQPKAPVATLEDVHFEGAHGTTPYVSAWEPCAPGDTDLLPHVELPYFDLGFPDLGSALAVVPASTHEDGSSTSPTLAFGAGNALWFLGPELEQPTRLELPAPLIDVERFGTSIDLIGDVDGDGSRDLLVEAFFESSELRRAFVVSTAHRRVLHEVQEWETDLVRAVATCRAPDRDYDGVDDIAVLQSYRRLESVSRRESSRLVILSPKSGRVLYTLCDLPPSHGPLALVEGESEASWNLVFEQDSRLCCVDLDSGRTMWSVELATERPHRLLNVATDSDLDGDGVRDLILRAAHEGGDWNSRIQWRSGRSGALLRTLTGTLVNRECGSALAPHIDVDDDGFHEWLATHYWGIGSFILVLSGNDGSVLRVIDDPFFHGSGSFLDATVDWDGGGLPDLVIGSHVRTVSEFEVCIVSMEDHCVLARWTEDDLRRLLQGR